jgi:hyperosmotically inducible protein
MLRGLLRLILVLIVLGVGAVLLLGWWTGGSLRLNNGAVLGTSGHVDTEHAREVGAQIGAKTADAAGRAEAALMDGALTTKIKSKMALDDTIKARGIDVSTTDHVVTLNGRVGSQAEHDRALQLARETDGVTHVVDHLTVR